MTARIRGKSKGSTEPAAAPPVDDRPDSDSDELLRRLGSEILQEPVPETLLDILRRPARPGPDDDSA